MTDLLPYEEVTTDDFARRAAKEFSATQPVPGTLVLTGPCPRCGAVIQVPVVDGVFKIILPSAGRRDQAPIADRDDEPVICTCSESHPSRPPDKVGCGAYWLLRISVAGS